MPGQGDAVQAHYLAVFGSSTRAVAGSLTAYLVAQMIEGRMAELKAMMPHADIPVHYEVVSGAPPVEVIERVERLGHDLVLTIPMPPLRRRGLGSASTTMHLLRKCPVPVWVHSPLTATAAAVLVALGPLEQTSHDLNIKLLELGSSLALTGDSELHVVHGWRLEGEKMIRSPRLGYSDEEIAAMGSAVRAEAEMEIGKLLDAVPGARDASVILRNGEAADVIVDAIDAVNPATVVMGTLARSGIPGYIIGNTAERVLVGVDRSVLAVKPEGFVSPVGAITSWHPGQMPY
jgi:nucleotide-binding universal stress UspA family protein